MKNQLKFSLKDIYPDYMSVINTSEMTNIDEEEMKNYQPIENGEFLSPATKEDSKSQIKFFMGVIVVLVLLQVMKRGD